MSEHTLTTAAEAINATGIHAGGNADAERKARRAAAALRAVQAYAETTGYGEGESVETIMSDLMADLRTLCVELTLPYAMIEARGAMYFREGY